jgi:hypothetical protein
MKKKLVSNTKATKNNEAEILEAEIKAMQTKLKGIKGASDVTQVTYGEYEGTKTMSLLKGESSYVNRPFSFGKKKAQMIVEAYEQIKAFAESK